MNLTKQEILVFVLVVAGIVLIGLAFLLVFGLAGGFGTSMMGPGMMGGGFAFWFLLCLGSVLLFGLVIGGVVLLMASSSRAVSETTLSCPSCGNAVQPDWKVCPTCGQPLKEGKTE